MGAKSKVKDKPSQLQKLSVLSLWLEITREIQDRGSPVKHMIQ